MKKEKETLWKLLTKLDEQSGQFNAHLHEANRYFDEAAAKTAKILRAQEEQLHKTIAKVKKAIEEFRKDKK